MADDDNSLGPGNDAPPELSFFQLYSACMVYLKTRDANGELYVGSAFHIGDGFLVTARHVIDDAEIVEAVPYCHSAKLSIESITIIVPDDPSVDLAILRSDFSLESHHRTRWWGRDDVKTVDHIEIGLHLDDWLGDGLVLSDVVLLGYPPIPFSKRPQLVAVEGQVNAVVDLDVANEGHPYFVVSPTARGGFSGGPVLMKNGGWLLGVLTTSLGQADMEAELGFAAALTVEPLWLLMAANRINPGGRNTDFLWEMGMPDEEDDVAPADGLAPGPEVERPPSPAS